MKNLYFVFVQTFDNKYHFAHAQKVDANNNLKSYFEGIPLLTCAQSCDTWKKALQVANFWNDCYKENGTLYKFDM